MVYRRYKKYSKRPGYGACGKMVYGDAQKALAVARGVKMLLNVELLHHDQQSTLSNISQVFNITQLTNLIQGDTNTTRTGDQVKFVSLSLRAFIKIHAAATASLVRCMIIKDKQTNGVIYTQAQVLADVTANDILVSPINLDNKFRFVILYDKLFNLSFDRASISFSKRIKLNLKVRYGSNAGTILDLNSDSLSLVFISNEAANMPNITQHTRLRYIDN